MFFGSQAQAGAKTSAVRVVILLRRRLVTRSRASDPMTKKMLRVWTGYVHNCHQVGCNFLWVQTVWSTCPQLEPTKYA